MRRAASEVAVCAVRFNSDNYDRRFLQALAAPTNPVPSQNMERRAPRVA